MTAKIRVKPLEWEVIEDEAWWGTAINAFNLVYEVRRSRSSTRVRFNSRSFEAFDGTADEAKAAAQADYERRILSALEVSP